MILCSLGAALASLASGDFGSFVCFAGLSIPLELSALRERLRIETLSFILKQQSERMVGR
jgi:hypothetical protein